MSNLVSHAEYELGLIAKAASEAEGGPDEMQAEMNRHLLEMVKLFAEEGHSGFSASYAIGVLQKLLRYEPLTPLTGEDHEWFSLDYGAEMAAQNKRCLHVFKRADGTAYDSEGRIFRYPDGQCVTRKGSAVDVAFPYVPSREYVAVDENGEESLVRPPAPSEAP